MVALSEIETRSSVSKRRGPRLTPEQKAEQKRQRTQAQVGLGSNVLGLTAGAAATGAALRDPRFGEKGAGRTANWVARQGEKIPQPIARATKHFTPKKAAALAGGALALQVGNVGGDVVANRVLSRSAKTPAAPVKKDESITDAYISKADKSTGHGSAYQGLSDDEFESRLRDKTRRRRRELAVQGTSSGAALGGLTGALVGSPHAKPKRIAGRAGIGAAVGGTTMAGLIHHAHEKNIKRAVKEPVARYALEERLQAHDRLKTRALEAQANRNAVGKAYRRYDPEADRQRRLGLYTGAGAGGALVLGAGAARNFTTNVGEHGASPAKKLKGIAVKAGKGKKALLLSTGAALSGGAGAAAYRRGLSERNNPWN